MNAITILGREMRREESCTRARFELGWTVIAVGGAKRGGKFLLGRSEKIASD